MHNLRRKTLYNTLGSSHFQQLVTSFKWNDSLCSYLVNHSSYFLHIFSKIGTNVKWIHLEIVRSILVNWQWV